MIRQKEHKKHYRELNEAYNYITKERAILVKESEKELDIAHENRGNVSKTKKAYKEVYGKYDKKIKQLALMDEAVLVWIVKNKNKLWS